MSSSSSLGDAFSFDTPEAVLQVLGAIRASEASAEKKNELRDLVLSFTNGGKDPSVQIQITQQLASLGVVPGSTVPSVSATAAQPVVHDFGSARNVPTFSPSTPTTAAPAPAAATPPPAPSEPAVAQPAPVADSSSVPPTPAPVTPPVTSAPAMPAPAVASTTQAVPTAPTPQPPVTPAPPVAPTQASPQSSAALNRIREIKSLVNERVGNPVNLVDIDNAVGREYMAALLDAMKQVSTGAVGESAMARLETALQSVESVLKSQTSSVSAPATASLTSPSTPTQVAQTPKKAESTSVVSPNPAKDSRSDVSDSRWGTDALQPQAKPGPVRSEQSVATHNTTLSTAEAQPKAEAAPVPTPVSDAPGATVRAINTAQPLKSITDLPTADSLKTSETGDPLFTKEVSDGLNQLLTDWVLFKKSGLFGTGPKGVEHPLYAKIKDLQIPLLLAGRFEGATQDIKQSITDYMNGWRYEQGIIYNQGETFDHYLRRVIKHILDLQK